MYTKKYYPIIDIFFIIIIIAIKIGNKNKLSLRNYKRADNLTKVLLTFKMLSKSAKF